MGTNHFLLEETPFQTLLKELPPIRVYPFLLKLVMLNKLRCHAHHNYVRNIQILSKWRYSDSNVNDGAPKHMQFQFLEQILAQSHHYETVTFYFIAKTN